MQLRITARMVYFIANIGWPPERMTQLSPKKLWLMTLPRSKACMYSRAYDIVFSLAPNHVRKVSCHVRPTMATSRPINRFSVMVLPNTWFALL